MPLKHPTLRYRPTRASDGEGGFTETLGASVTIYGAIELHKNKTVLVCEIHDDVDTGDVIVAEGGRYRVSNEIERVMNTRSKRVGLEKIERPISPS